MSVDKQNPSVTSEGTVSPNAQPLTLDQIWEMINHSPERQPDETFADYKMRQRILKQVEKMKLAGLTWYSSPLPYINKKKGKKK